jgi:hypothetical protein
MVGSDSNQPTEILSCMYYTFEQDGINIAMLAKNGRITNYSFALGVDIVNWCDRMIDAIDCGESEVALTVSETISVHCNSNHSNKER